MEVSSSQALHAGPSANPLQNVGVRGVRRQNRVEHRPVSALPSAQAPLDPCWVQAIPTQKCNRLGPDPQTGPRYLTADQPRPGRGSAHMGVVLIDHAHKPTPEESSGQSLASSGPPGRGLGAGLYWGVPPLLGRRLRISQDPDKLCHSRDHPSLGKWVGKQVRVT